MKEVPLAGVAMRPAGGGHSGQSQAVVDYCRCGAPGQLATNGLEVLAALDEDSFDVILMDEHMPDLDGFKPIRSKELFEAVEEGYKNFDSFLFLGNCSPSAISVRLATHD